MAENSRSTVASEDELGEKWDRCVADTILKTGTSLVHRLPESEDAGKFLIRAHPISASDTCIVSRSQTLTRSLRESGSARLIRARWHAGRQTA